MIVALASTAASGDAEITREEEATTSHKPRKKDRSSREAGKLKFNYRSMVVEKAEDGSLTGTINSWNSSTTTRPFKYGNMSISVPKGESKGSKIVW